MPRFARLVVPGHSHHITQRGNRRQKVFFSDKDRAACLEFLKVNCMIAEINIWAYCLMENHVHFVTFMPRSELPRIKEIFAIIDLSCPSVKSFL